MSDNTSQPSKLQRFSLPYILFSYKKELMKRNVEFIRLSVAKIYLTDKLIVSTLCNITKYDVSEVMNINQQLIFKKKLCNKIKKIKNLEKLGITHINPNCLSDDI